MAGAATRMRHDEADPDDVDVVSVTDKKPGIPTAVKKLAEGAEVSAADVTSATDWFLERADDPSPDSLRHTHDLDVNVGGLNEGVKRIVRWVITSVDPTEEERIRKAVLQLSRRGKGRNAQLTAEDLDEGEFQARMVVAGSVDPNFWEIAESSARYAQYKAPDRYSAPVAALKWGLRHKPGLIQQIAGHIGAMSGYDNDDVKDAQKAGKG
jgi:hypothetical protein